MSPSAWALVLVHRFEIFEHSVQDGWATVLVFQLLKYRACFHLVCIVRLDLSHGVEILIAPQAEGNRSFAILIREHRAFRLGFTGWGILRADYGHLADLLRKMFWAGEKFNRALTVISTFHGNLMYETHTD